MEPQDDVERRLAALEAEARAAAARAHAHHHETQARLTSVLTALEVAYDDDRGDRERLRALRASPAYGLAFTEEDPLVSVVIPTFSRAEPLVTRAIPSVLAQTHANLEVIVVGDHAEPEVLEAMAEVSDPRVRFVDLPYNGPYRDEPREKWLAVGTPPINRGLALARGRWIGFLGDDDALFPDHVGRLLAFAREQELELAYGRIRVHHLDGSQETLGAFPPAYRQINLQASLYHAGLRFLELELGHAVFDKVNDWGLFSRMLRIGVRAGFAADLDSVAYHPSPGAAAAPLLQAPADVAAALAAGAARETRLQAELDALHRADRDVARLQAHRDDLDARLRAVQASRSWRLTAPLRRLRRS